MPDLNSTYHVHRTALIDADYIAFQTAAWAQSHQMDEEEMTTRLLETLGLWIDMACASDAILFFSGPREECFRRKEYPAYKANRTAPKPELLGVAWNVLKDTEFSWHRMPHVEADDLLGIVMTNGKVVNPVCVSRDKDLRQVPGWHLNPFVDDFPVFVTEEEADRVFHSQWLSGDSVDGFPGIRGTGPKKAEKLLSGVPADKLTSTALKAYEDAGQTLEDALKQARCARILRASDWDPKTKEPVLWSPPSETQQ